MKALGALLSLFVISLALLFLPAWTLNYWQAWLYLAILMVVDIGDICLSNEE